MIDINTRLSGHQGEHSRNETNLSTEQHSKKTDAWFSCPYGNTRRTEGAQAAAGQRTEAIDGERAAETRTQITKRRNAAHGHGAVS
jgi:hypothetical protein